MSNCFFEKLKQKGDGDYLKLKLILISKNCPPHPVRLVLIRGIDVDKRSIIPDLEMGEMCMLKKFKTNSIWNSCWF